MKGVATSNLKGIIAILASALCIVNSYGQYTSQREHYRAIDSLEHLLLTNPPEGVDLLLIYSNLAYGSLRNDYEKVKYYSQKGVTLARQLDLPRVEAFLHQYQGMASYHECKYDSAMFHYNNALDAAVRMKTSKSSSGKPYSEESIDEKFTTIYGDIGNVYNIQGKYHEAIEFYTKILTLSEKHGWKDFEINVLENIAEMYLSMDNYERAEDYFLQAAVIVHEINDSLRIALNKERLSKIYMLQQKYYDKALEYALDAYNYLSNHPQEQVSAIVVSNTLASIYMNGFNDYGRAEEYVKRALEMLESFDEPREKSISLRLSSVIYSHHNQWRQAEQTALDALVVDDTEPANTIALYEILSKAYAKLGDSDKAWDYFDNYKTLQSSWSTRHYQSAIREMEVKYETEKKETRIVTLEEERKLIIWLGIAAVTVLLLLLTLFIFLWWWSAQKKRATEQRIEQEKQLIATQALLDGEILERTRLARDLHDGLGSMLTSIRIGLENMKDEELEGSIGMLNDSIVELRRIAHHLMPASLSRDGLKTALTDFFRSLPSVQFSYFGNEERIEPKMEMLIYRIIHELVNNALKYSGASTINVQIIQEQEYIAFTVSDDGCGFDPNAETEGMGLWNIRDRVASYNGRILIDSIPREGTEININFNLTEGNNE